MQQQVTLGDMFHRIMQTAEDTRAGRLDVQQAIATAANYKMANDMLNAATNVVKMELLAGMPYRSPFDVIANRSEPEHPPIDSESIKQLANVTVDAEKQPKNRKPKIGVVGLAPNQAGTISEKFGEFADFEFWKDDGVGRLQQMAKSMDIIFVNVSQVSHQSTQILDSCSANYKMSGQGTSKMIETIKKHFESLKNE